MTVDKSVQSAKPSHLTSLKLGGFQVFDDVTEIPLGALTFLFGPNSAGKSAVEDGLLLLADLLVDDYSLHTQRDILLRHWRRLEGGSFAPVLTIGLAVLIDVDLQSAVSGSVRTPFDDNCYTANRWDTHEVSPIFEFHGWDGDYGVGWTFGSPDFKLVIDQSEALRLVGGQRVGVNFNHPVLRGFRLQHDFEALAASLPFFSVEEGWVYFNSDHAGWSGYTANRELLLSGAPSAIGPRSVLDRDDLLRNRSAIDELLDIYACLQDIATRKGNAHFRPHLVEASRRIPSRQELTFLCDGDDDEINLNFELEPDPAYRNLALSALASRTGRNWYPSRSVKHSVGLGGEQIFVHVNKALTDHLFVDRGYALAAEVRLLIDWGDGCSDVCVEQEDVHRYPAIVQLHLIDHAGRRYDFHDVGSGLGYVLPVLCSVCDASKLISMLQQPELHLHPALQAALADVLIENTRGARQIIVETHSEHLLLRVLKRIRQAASGKQLSPELQIKPEEVAVVYFEPQPNGTTAVKRLRISQDGEFLDRWPRGFFTERDSELFDE